MDTVKTNDKIYAKGTKRNFPQVEKKTYYSFEDIRKGDLAGTTDTDTKTDTKDKESNNLINKKQGSSNTGGTKLGTSVKLDKHARIG